MSERISLADCVQTRTQLPQPMQRSAMTLACPSSTLIAWAGQLRTQL